MNGLKYEDLLKTTEESTLESELNILENMHIEDYVNWNELNGEVFHQKVGIATEDEDMILPMYLTKDERKKLKRKRKH